MLKKARAERDAGAGAEGEKELAKSVLESSRQIWLAGLGAFSRAQAEGMKVFESLVKTGEAVETKTRRGPRARSGATIPAPISRAPSRPRRLLPRRAPLSPSSA